MIVAESRRNRRLIGRLDRGADLLPALAEVCAGRGVHCAEIRAFGTLEEVELREWDQQARAFRPARRFATPCSLVQLLGNLSELDGRAHIEAQATIARDRDSGIELLGGQLARARVHAVDFVIEAFDDVLLRREVVPPLGLPLFVEAIEEEALQDGPGARASEPATIQPGSGEATLVAALAEPAPRFEAPARGHVAPGRGSATPAAAPAQPSWAEVAAASAATAATVERGAEQAEDEPLRAGDVIDHPKFGRCEVERIEGGDEYAQVRLRNQRLVRLSLDVLQVEREGTEADGRRRFRAVPAR